MPAILMPEPKEPPFAQQPPPGAMPPPVPGKTAFEGGGFVNPANTFVNGLQTGQNLAQGYENLKEQRQAFPTAQAGRDLDLLSRQKDFAKLQATRTKVGGVYGDIRDAYAGAAPNAPPAGGIPTAPVAGALPPVAGALPPAPPAAAMPPPIPGHTAFEGGGFVDPANTFVHGLQTGQNLAQGYENLKEQRQAFPTAQAGRDLALQEQSSNYAKQQNIRDRVSSVFQDLHDGSLNDNHVPNGQVGIGTPPSPGAPDATQGVPTSSTAGNMAPVNSPSDAPQAAIRTAASDPATQAGIPQQTPAQSGKPHSLGPEYWDGLNAKIADAAAAAGEDGPRLYEALMGQRDHFFQSQVLKNLSAANMALLNGDSKGVEQAMKNVYYYFPDGKDLDIKKGPNGELQYQDPMNPELPDGSPNMHTVDAAHLQLLGEAALDPMKVASTLAGRAAAAAEMRLKTSQAQSDLLKASAAGVTAQAALNKSNSEARRVAAQNFKDYGFGVMATARGQYYTNRLTQMALTGAFGQAIKPGDALRYQQAAVQAVGRLVNPTTISTDPISAGKMVPNPAAQPPWAKGLGSEGIANITATTQALIVNNPELGPDGNARIAAAMFRNQGMKGPDGKSLVRLSPDGGQAAVFVDGRWATVRIPPMLGASLKSGKRFVPPPTSGGTGAISTPEDDTQAAQDEQTDDNITSMGEGD